MHKFGSDTDIPENPYTYYYKILISEFIASFLYNFSGIAALAMENSSTISSAIAFGFIMIHLLQVFGPVSGCHMNPVITVTLMSVQKAQPDQFIHYIAGQILGAITAVKFLEYCLPHSELYLGVTDISEKITPFQGYLIEATLTLQLTLTVLGIWEFGRDVRVSPAIAIGVTVCACHIIGYKLTGASMNPARSFGPALVNGYWKNHWIYWAGPFTGGFIATRIFVHVVCRFETKETIDF